MQSRFISVNADRFFDAAARPSPPPDGRPQTSQQLVFLRPPVTLPSLLSAGGNGSNSSRSVLSDVRAASSRVAFLDNPLAAAAEPTPLRELAQHPAKLVSHLRNPDLPVQSVGGGYHLLGGQCAAAAGKVTPRTCELCMRHFSKRSVMIKHVLAVHAADLHKLELSKFVSQRQVWTNNSGNGPPANGTDGHAVVAAAGKVSSSSLWKES